MARKIALVLSVLILVLTGVLGTYNGVTELRDAHTGLQKAVTGGVLLYGVLGIVSAYGLLRRRRWSAASATAWGVVVTFVAATAALAYAPADASLGAALAAGLGSALIGAVVIWAARSSTRADR